MKIYINCINKFLTFSVQNASNNYAFLSICNRCSRLSTSSKDKSEEYLRQFLESRQLPNWLLNKPHSELQTLITLILNQYEYQLYQKSYEHLEAITSDTSIFEGARFQLQLHELNDILQSQDQSERENIIHYFVKSKTLQFVSRHAKSLTKKTNNEEYEDITKSRLQVHDPTGLWNFQNELVYGLWHNCLFTKFKRTSYSALYEKRMASAVVVDPSNTRLILDFDYANHLSYFFIRRLGADIRQLIAYNKYHSFQPFTLEMLESQSTRSKQFDDLMGRVISTWNDNDHFPFVRHQGKTIDELAASSPNSIYYIIPTARKALALREVLHPDSVFVLPAYVTGNARDPVFSKIASRMTPLNVNLRRIPTQEHVVWNKFHGVMKLDTVFAILHDARHEVNFKWKTSLRRHLTGETIKTEEEMINSEVKRRSQYKKRVDSIERSFEQKGSKAPQRIVTSVNKSVH